MNKLEEAIIYATIMHQGKVRKFGNSPFILHPLEVSQILSTMTEDIEVITAGILHDIVEGTDGTLEEIEKRFGNRVAELVSSDSEKEYPGEELKDTWKRRKEESLFFLKNCNDNGTKMLWLADKLADIRSLAAIYSEMGDALWQNLDEENSDLQLWYYRSIAETLELSLNKTGAFKELIKHINFIWPGTFDSDKARYRKYREVSVDGCKRLGRGAKGEVYRYDDELVIKVFNQKNTYRDVEQEIAFSRKAFVLGVPTAISFGIVSVGEQYGAMYELVESDTISSLIERAPGQVENYAKIMAEVAHTIHDIEVSDDDGFPYASERLKEYINKGIALVDEELADRCRKLVDTISGSSNLVHGDFHTGNVFLQNGEPLLIDMDRISMGHPVIEIGNMHYFYEVLGERSTAVVEEFMGFSYETARQFYRFFLLNYLGTEDEEKLRDVHEKASFLSYTRVLHRIHKKFTLSEEEKAYVEQCVKRISDLVDRLDTLAF